mgnify:FL=1
MTTIDCTPTRPVDSDDAFVRLRDYVIQRTGLQYYVDKSSDLERRLQRRLQVRHITTCDAYRELIEQDPQEFERLVSELTIGETYFFRHAEMFRALGETVFPDLLDRNGERRQLRVWCAGCSIGAEPYSLAILLKRQLAAGTRGWDIRILATDINSEYLAQAERGEFEEWTLRSLPAEVKDACFTPIGKQHRIRPEYTDCVDFRQHNLVEDGLPVGSHHTGRFDLILCRNVIIYFSRDTTRQLINQFYDALTPAGWIAVGHSEPNATLFHQFQTVACPGAILYRRKPCAVSDAAPKVAYRESPDRRVLRPTVTASPELADPSSTRHQRSGSAVAPPAHRQPVAERMRDGSQSALGELRTLADQGKIDESLARCKALLLENDLDPRVHLYHAMLLQQVDQTRECFAAVKRSLFLNRRDPFANYYHGLLLTNQGQADAADRSFRFASTLLDGLDDSHIVVEDAPLTAGDLKELLRRRISPGQEVRA